MNDKMDFADIKASGSLPSPKGVMLAVMRLCQREQVSLQELAHAIQADPVLAGRIIKVANVANPNTSGLPSASRIRRKVSCIHR